MVYILLAMGLYTVSIMIATFASRRLDSNVVSAVVNTISAFLPIAVILPHINKKLFDSTQAQQGLIAAIIGGITIALFTMALNKSFATNKVAIVTPIIFGGSIFFTSLLSYVLFKEKISPFQGLGLALVLGGLLLVIYSKITGR